MQIFMKIVLAVCGLLVLNACFIGTETIYQDRRDSFYSPNLVRNVAKSGEMATALIGKPFPNSGAGKNDRANLLAGIYLPSYLGVVPLAPIDKTNRPRGRLVLLFDPDKQTDSNDICTGSPVIFQPTGNTMKVQAVFCFDDHLVSEATMKMHRPSGPDSREYRNSMSNLITALLPSRGPHSGDCPSKGGC